MRLHTHQLGLALAVLIVTLVLGGGTVIAASEYLVADQGWRIVEQAGARTLELRALVVNASESPLTHEVRFVVERMERAAQTGQPAQPGKADGQQNEPVWSTVQTTSASGGTLAPDESAVVTATIPYELLQAGTAYRFRADLRNTPTGPVLASAAITSLQRPFAASMPPSGAAPAATERLAKGLASPLGISGPHAGSSPGRPTQESAPRIEAQTPARPGNEESLAEGPVRAGDPTSDMGTGKMKGDHTAQRVGDEWVEHGFGVITLTGKSWTMKLDYVYDAHGLDAASLVATGTGRGWLYSMFGTFKGRHQVRVDWATAQMTDPGTRTQKGQLIERKGATATGTFSGFVGGGSPGKAPHNWYGSLDMTNGTQNLHLALGTGKHEFEVVMNASTVP